MDNKAVETIVRIGSKKAVIHDVAMALYRRCRELNITLIVEWRSRDDPLIQLAFLGSRLFDESSYGLNFDSFWFLASSFSNLNCEVDCMAEVTNKKCARFFSRFPESEAKRRNFFSQKLDSGTVYYCFPPPSLITATLLHFLKFGAHGLLLVPWWPSCTFWCWLTPEGVHLSKGIKSFLKFRPYGFVVEEGVSSGTFKGQVSFDMLALEFNFLDLEESDLGIALLEKSNSLSYGCARCC